MRTPIRLRGRTRFPSPLVAVALAASLLGPLGAAAPAVASPARQAAAPAAAPAAPGPVAGTPCSPGCDLYAIAGTMPAASLPGAPAAGIPVWGYNTTNAAVTAPGGPTLVVTEGQAITIHLHNSGLPSATSLMIAGQPGAPDTVGVTNGNSKDYSLPAAPNPGALKAGTYLYEAGLTADGPRQVAMGLYGALIVRPTGAPLQAYADPSTAFADEAVLVLSEIDPAFNAAPTTFDLTDFAPKYWLINGKVYPNTESIGTAGEQQGAASLRQCRPADPFDEPAGPAPDDRRHRRAARRQPVHGGCRDRPDRRHPRHHRHNARRPRRRTRNTPCSTLPCTRTTRVRQRAA